MYTIDGDASRSRSRRGLAPVALRGGRHGAATAPPARGARHPMRQWRRFGNVLTAAREFHVVRVMISTVTLASTRSEHGIPGPRRRQARSPAAAVSNTPGCRPDERLSSRPRGAGWSEAVRGTGVPRAAEGAVELQTQWREALLAPISQPVRSARSPLPRQRVPGQLRCGLPHRPLPAACPRG